MDDDEIIVDHSFPSGENIEFQDSSFFRDQKTDLPTPAEVREVASHTGNLASKRLGRPPPVKFHSLQLLVKYGSQVSTAEAKCLWLVRKLLSPHVPVPEVYGWKTDGGQSFIYMELINGVTLQDSWDALDEHERTSVCSELRTMARLWRRLRQDSAHTFVGTIDNRPLLDIIFETAPSNPGPFPTVAEFHDYFTSAVGHGRENWRGLPPNPYRPKFPDDVAIVFTHGDLHPSNIILTRGPNPHVASIIDWQQSGWYPAYWEYCKARWTAKIGAEWDSKYLPQILNFDKVRETLDRPDSEGIAPYDYWDYFVLARGK